LTVLQGIFPILLAELQFLGNLYPWTHFPAHFTSICLALHRTELPITDTIDYPSRFATPPSAGPSPPKCTVSRPSTVRTPIPRPRIQNDNGGGRSFKLSDGMAKLSRDEKHNRNF